MVRAPALPVSLRRHPVLPTMLGIPGVHLLSQLSTNGTLLVAVKPGVYADAWLTMHLPAWHINRHTTGFTTTCQRLQAVHVRGLC